MLAKFLEIGLVRIMDPVGKHRILIFPLPADRNMSLRI
jgi:hypothetical protein